MKDIRLHRVTLYVPAGVEDRPLFKQAADALTREHGGVTLVDATGRWWNGDHLIEEPVTLYTWWGDSVIIVKDAVIAMLQAGEEAVMSEVTTGLAQCATVLTREDYPEVFSH